MEDLIQLLIFLVIAIVSIAARILSRRQRQSEPEEPEIELPPWGNFPMPEESTEIDERPPVKTQPTRPQPIPQAAPQPSRIAASIPSAVANTQQAPPNRQRIVTIAGLPITPQTFRQGIILMEILGKPKVRRSPRQ